jgi:hypothetical protein
MGDWPPEEVRRVGRSQIFLWRVQSSAIGSLHSEEPRRVAPHDAFAIGRR